VSRIGKKPILIPEKVEVEVEDNQVIVKGPSGFLSCVVRPEIKIEVKEGKIFASPRLETKQTKALWGLTRALIANMIKGVISEYKKQLQIEGIGYKAVLEGNDLVLNVGYTHPVKVTAPAGIKFTVEKNIIIISGIDKQLVSATAAKIKKIKPPEPYKGKGIRYISEIVKKKIGKKAVAVAAGGK